MNSRRGIVLAGLALVHLLVVALVLRSVTVPRTTEAASVAVVNVPLPPAATFDHAPPPTEIAIAANVDAPEITVSEGTSSGDCALGGEIERALAQDDAAVRALVAIPASVRSVANAAMLWDGRWSPADSAPGAVRQVIEAVVRTAPLRCRDALVVGPRLVFVASAGGIALAIGSGRWTWNDLLE